MRDEIEVFLGLVSLFNESCVTCASIEVCLEVDNEQWEGGTLRVYFKPSVLELVAEDLTSAPIPAVFPYSSDARALNTKCARCRQPMRAFQMTRISLFELVRLNALAAYKRCASEDTLRLPESLVACSPRFGDGTGFDDYILASGLTHLLRSLISTLPFVEYPYAVYLGPFHTRDQLVSIDEEELKECTEQDVSELLYRLICELVQSCDLRGDLHWRQPMHSWQMHAFPSITRGQMLIVQRALKLLGIYAQTAIAPETRTLPLKLLFLLRLIGFVVRIAAPSEYVFLKQLWHTLYPRFKDHFPAFDGTSLASEIWMCILLGQFFNALDAAPFHD